MYSVTAIYFDLLAGRLNKYNIHDYNSKLLFTIKTDMGAYICSAYSFEAINCLDHHFCRFY